MTRRVPVMRPAARGGLAAAAALHEHVRVAPDGVVEVVGGRLERRPASGPALHVRRRPIRTVDGDRVVEEQRLVLWARPDLEVVVHLSLYAVDLVEGGRAATPLRELGASLSWDVV